MPQGPDGKTIIIVKKVAGHGGHHGGSWKVAYADFVTSMMAFFMVLWLVNSASVQVRERIASYFRAPGVFEKGSGTPMELGGAGILLEAFAPPAESNSQVQPNDRIYEVGTKDGEKRESFGEGGGDGHLQQGQQDLEKGGYRGVEEQALDDQQKAALEKQRAEFEKAAEQIKEIIDKQQKEIAGMIGKIEVSVDQRGLHLEIMDTPYASMFARGSAAVAPAAEAELAKIGNIIKLLPNPVDIEGHTDSAPYRGKIADRYDNWTLSSDRANAARLILKRSGMADGQIARVVGYSSQRPKNPTDTLDASNRRISVSMRYTEQAAASLSTIGAKETQSIPLRRPRDPSSAKNQNAQTKKDAQQEPKKNELRVEVSTSPPQQNRQPEVVEVPTEPAWVEKDLIFGEGNPFFSR